ncbi:hypothetical protein DICPUDRAFT_93648 [Dictyostelium purpureum]|uniref:Rho-GAP domain-containing protein n=1 Tax=Dictyostelium purpureum TaxID=5786 RepID=F0ZA54_DICPU|nr:uncharacterized protein DICPUDRAFT_93648 [Dictyostelium purpureum]EGC39176.1 hypothetical protein DICPUDRAFT_93648 [Dictyostelium purpureum]|eukprot:XP_003284322.1 hypothetical protein DICPUDRAFT_93648 [Dictyostelium purpureum]
MTLVYDKSSFLNIMAQVAVLNRTSSGDLPIITSNSISLLSSSSSTQSIQSPVGNPSINVTPLIIQNKDEEKMTLSQLLACFPEPPSYIPIQPPQLNTSQHKLRRDTVVSPPTITSKQSSIIDSKPNNIILNNSINNINNSPQKQDCNNLASGNNGLNASNNPIIIYSSSEELPNNNIPLDCSSESSNCSDLLNQSTNSTSNYNILQQSQQKESIQLGKSQSLDNIDLIASNSPSKEIEQQDSGNVTPIPLSPISSAGQRSSQSSQSSEDSNSIITNANVITSPPTSQSPQPISPLSESSTAPTSVTTQPPTTTTSTNNTNSTNHPALSVNNRTKTTHNLTNPNSPNHSNKNQNNSSPLSPAKRLTIAFGSLTRGSSNNTPQPVLSIVPIKWEINLNQSKVQLNGSSAQAPTNLFESYVKLCKGDYSPNTSDFNKTFNQLLDLDINSNLSMLEKVYESILKGNNGLLSSKDQFLTKDKSNVKSLLSAVKSVVSEDIVNVKPSKSMMYFGSFGKTIPINQEVTDEIILNSFASKKVKYRILLGPPSKSHTISIQEKEGHINKKSSITLSFSLVLKSSIKLRRVVVIEIEGGVKYFILIQVESNKTAFGQPIEDSELVEDNTSFGPMSVPRALVILKQSFFSSNAHLTESIFRLPPANDSEYNIVKDRINREAIGCTEPHCIATLIKVFFRELPNLLLNDLDPQIFLNFKSTSNSNIAQSANTSNTVSQSNSNESFTDPNLDPVFVVNQIPDPKRSTFLWLVDLLAEVTKYENENKMTAKNLSIIFSPNLYIPPSNIVSTEDSFAISGKVVNFILELIQFNKSL